MNLPEGNAISTTCNGTTVPIAIGRESVLYSWSRAPEHEQSKSPWGPFSLENCVVDTERVVDTKLVFRGQSSCSLPRIRNRKGWQNQGEN